MVGDARLPEAYASWQTRLSREFFNGRKNQPVVMFVDRGLLQELAEPGEDGSRALADAVHQLVDLSAERLMFARAEAAQSSWRRGARDQPPPTLPILALSVLAASEMSRKGLIASNNYYIPFAKALLPDGSDTEVSHLRDLLRDRGAFASVADMWTQLHRWLAENNGHYGISTIREHPELTRIGYPLSQTLVRRSDRAALTRFFARLNLSAEGVPGPASLFSMLKVWTSYRSQGLSERFIASLTEPTVQDYMRTLVHQLAVAWDGKIITAEGLRRLELRLVVDLDRSSAWWVIPQVQGVAEDLLSGTCGGNAFTARIATDAHSSLYHTGDLPPVETSALTTGLVARGASSVAEFQPSKLVVLSDNADAGGWMSVDAVQPYEEHAFVVWQEGVAVVERVLTAAADGGWRRMSQSIVDQFLRGYAIYYGITFSDQGALESALAELPINFVANLRTGVNVRPRLVNGLPILRNVARNIYLSGGEPDLALPVGAEPRRTAVTIDGITDTVLASIFPLPISRIDEWEPGTHTVQADGEELRFVVAPSGGDDRPSAGTGSLGWEDGELRSCQSDASICGALVADVSPDRPVLARRGSSESWLILPNGQLTELAEPSIPNGFERISFPLFEVDHPRAVWLAQKRRDRWMISRIRFREPNFRTLSSRDHSIWSQLVLSVTSADPIWKMYVKAWKAFSAR